MADPTQTATAPVTASTAPGNPLPASAQAALSQGVAPVQAAPVAAQAAAPPASAQATAAPPAVPVNPKAPHANLVNMIQNLALGVDSFARAAATHGREGGVGEVQDYYAKQQQQAIQKQQATQEQEEFDLRMKAQNANLLMQKAQYEHSMRLFPLEEKQEMLGYSDALSKAMLEAPQFAGMSIEDKEAYAGLPASEKATQPNAGQTMASQPGVITVPFTKDQNQATVLNSIQSAVPPGKTLSGDYVTVSTGGHGKDGAATLIPSDNPNLDHTAASGMVMAFRNSVDAAERQGVAAGVDKDPRFVQAKAAADNMLSIIDKGGQPTYRQLHQMNFSTIPVMTSIIGNQLQANKITKDFADTQSAQAGAAGAQLKAQQDQQLHQAYLASGSKLPEADWTAVNKTTLTSNAENKSRLDYAPAIAGAEETARQNASNKPVYAINPSGDTVLTTYLTASNDGMHGIRQVSEADISKDQHDVKVLSDIQSKANNVAQAAGAMDSNSWTQAAIAAKVLADNPNTTVNTLFKSSALKNATPQTRAYVIAINSLRESSMGLQKVLTGSARSNETQMAALLNTLPGVEPDAGTVKQKLGAFTQNLNLLAQGLPKGTGVELQGFGGQQPQQPQQQTHAFSASAWQRANPNGDVNAAIAQARQQNYTVVQ